MLALLLACLRVGSAEVDADRYREGRFVYQRHCVACHGRWGDGKGEMAVGMDPRPRRFSSARFKYRSTPSGRLPTDDDLVRTIRSGIANTAMPAFGLLSDRELQSVVTYVKAFSTRWSKPDLAGTPVPIPPLPPWWDRPAERSARARAGEAAFRDLCASCHGDSGRGNGPAAATLVDEREEPSIPADLTRPLWSSGPSPLDVFRTLTTGLDGTPMPAYADTTPPEVRWDLVAWLDSIRRTAP